MNSRRRMPSSKDRVPHENNVAREKRNEGGHVVSWVTYGRQGKARSWAEDGHRHSITRDRRVSKLYEIPDRGTTRGALYARIGARAQPTGKTRGRLGLPRG